MFADTEIEFTPDLVDGHTPAVELQALIATFQVAGVDDRRETGRTSFAYFLCL